VDWEAVVAREVEDASSSNASNSDCPEIVVVRLKKVRQEILGMTFQMDL
jgi:hypothetical protein